MVPLPLSTTEQLLLCEVVSVNNSPPRAEFSESTSLCPALQTVQDFKGISLRKENKVILLFL